MGCSDCVNLTFCKSCSIGYSLNWTTLLCDEECNRVGYMYKPGTWDCIGIFLYIIL
jgi:hypothetical protein